MSGLSLALLAIVLMFAIVVPTAPAITTAPLSGPTPTAIDRNPVSVIVLKSLIEPICAIGFEGFDASLPNTIRACSS